MRSCKARPPLRRGTEVVVTGAPRKRVVAQAARGFESHPLRQPSLNARFARSYGWLTPTVGALASVPTVARSDLSAVASAKAEATAWRRWALREGCPP